MRVGLICSSGGSVFSAGVRLLRECGHAVDVRLVTDRPCGAEAQCNRLGIEWRRIERHDREDFSRDAASWLIEEHAVDWICLFFLRLVSQQFFSPTPCVNIHPSLLPAYPGFGAVRRAREDGVLFLGATAHLVDDTVDRGSIIVQVVAPIVPRTELDYLNRISFAQKLYIFLVLFELAESRLLDPRSRTTEIAANANPVLPWANPALRDQRLGKAFDDFLISEGIEWKR